MNRCRETTKMGVPARHASKARRAGNRATVPRHRGIGSEAYLNGTSKGPTPEDARKDGHIVRARCAPLSPASGFPSFVVAVTPGREFMKYPGSAGLALFIGMRVHPRLHVQLSAFA
jgi:hypothetical protein